MSTLAFTIVTGVASFGLVMVHYALIDRRARARQRAVEAAEAKALAEAEASVKEIGDRIRANVRAFAESQAQHHAACPCGECADLRRWCAGRNN